jgi:putative peptidoglycan lipid II flippase
LPVSSGRLARSAGVIGTATFTSRVLGVVRDWAQAYFFGTSLAADAFTIATRIPTLLRDLFAEGAMSAAFVPTLGRTIVEDGREAAWRLGSQVVNGLLLVTAVLVVLGIIFAAPLTGTYAEEFARTPGKLELTIELTRINMPFLTLVAIAAAFMGMLNAARRFVIPAFAPATYNVVFIACTFLLVPLFRSEGGVEPVMALSIGTLLGGLAQVLTQWPALRREGYRHRWILDVHDARLREVLRLMGPATLGVAAAQVSILVTTYLATSQPGVATALTYAFRLIYMPIGIIGVSVATAAIPELSRQAAAGDHGQMRATLSSGLRMMLMLAVPATVGLMVLDGPIVELIFEYGEFRAADTALTAGALFYYAPAIVGYSVVKIAAPSFYSLQDARTPAAISVVSILLNVMFCVMLFRQMGYSGLALGTALAASVNAGALLVLLSRRIGGLEGARVLVSFVKICVAAAAMGVAASWFDASLRELWPGASVGARLVRVGGAIGGAIGVLAVAAFVLRIEEFRQVVRRVLRRGPGGRT